MVIQEAPQRFEEARNQILVGDTQQKLNYLLNKAGIDYNEVYFTSAVKCHVKKNSMIKKKHMVACQKYLFNEIMEHKPKAIIVMGRWAWQAVSNFTSIREFAGHFDEFEMDYEVSAGSKKITKTFTTKVMPTYGLGGSLRKWEWNNEIIRHFKRTADYVKTGKIPKTKQPKVNTILTRQGLDDFYELAKKQNKCATDCETTGFNFWEHKIINVGYCFKPGEAHVIYLEKYKKKHTEKWDKLNIKRAKQINRFLKEHGEYAKKILKKVNALKNLQFILHNGKFDAKFVAANGMPYYNFWYDTLLASPLIDENLGHALNMCLERNEIHYGAYDTKLWPYTNKDEKKKKSYQYIPPLMLEKYLGMDVDGDFRLYLKQVPVLKSEGLYKHLMGRKMPSLRKVISIEYTGVKANRGLIKKASNIIEGKQKQLLKKLYKITNNKKFNPNSPIQVIDYMVDKGYPFEKLKIGTTDSGNYSTAAAELEKFTKYKKWKEFPNLVLNCKKLSKIRGTYIDGKDGKGGMLQYLDEKNRIHANFNLWTARTSRQSCFAKGTPIEIVRNMRHNPKGIVIENVKVGDLAYCYDNDKNLVLRKVKQVYSNGKKGVVRMHWVSSGGRLGYVDVTADHKIRTRDYGYQPVDELQHGDRLLFLSRKAVGETPSSGYGKLMYHGSSKICSSGVSDHRFIFEQINGEISDNCDIHHINQDHLDNNTENLMEMDKGEHRSLHAKEWANKEEKKRLSSEVLKRRWANGEVEIPKGENHPCYKGWSKSKLLKIIMRSGGRVKYTKYDYYTIMKYVKLHNLNWAEIKDRFTHEGEFLQSQRIRNCVNGTFEQAKSELKIGQAKWVRLKERFGSEENHQFLMLEHLGYETEVYDLEIEDYHNYIAGEICAHNCNRPSLQVWPRPIPGLPNTRNFIVPTNDKWCFFEADYSQLEQCIVAGLSKDKMLVKRIQGGMDLHCANSADLGVMLGSLPKWVTYEHMLVTNDKGHKVKDQKQVKDLLRQCELDGKDIDWHEKRTQAKGIGFGLNYGKGALSFSEEFGISLDEAQEMIDAYFNIYKGMYKWREGIIKQALTKGFITLESGRKRRFNAGTDWINSDYSDGVWSAGMLREEMSRQAMNFPVQGGAHEIFEPAYIRFLDGVRAEKLRARLLLLIHDGIVGECLLHERKKIHNLLKSTMETTMNPGTKYEIKLNLDVDFYEKEWYGPKVKIF